MTLPQGQTVMAPIVDRTVPIERVALYRAAEGGPHPSAALRLRNTTGASLPAGLATLYETLPDGGLTFLGDAPLPQLAPGGEELLAYGLDGNIDVAVQQESRGRVDRARVADGVLELTRLEQQQFTYAVTARFAGAPRSFVLEQTAAGRLRASRRRRTRWSRARRSRSTAPWIRAHASSSPWCWSGRSSSGSRCSITTRRRFCSSSRVWSRRPSCARRLARLQELSGTVAGLERQIAEASARRDELAQDQARLRENLAAVPAESDLARRYLGGLAASEDELDGAGHAPRRPAGGAGAGGAGAGGVRPLAAGVGRLRRRVPGGGCDPGRRAQRVLRRQGRLRQGVEARVAVIQRLLERQPHAQGRLLLGGGTGRRLQLLGRAPVPGQLVGPRLLDPVELQPEIDRLILDHRVAEHRGLGGLVQPPFEARRLGLAQQIEHGGVAACP